MLWASSSTRTRLGLRAENGVEVHLGERVALIGNNPARDDFEPLKKRLGLLAAMRLDNADDDIDALGLFCPRHGQHFIGLADAGRGAEKSTAALFGLLRFTQKSVAKADARRYRVSPCQGILTLKGARDQLVW